MAKYIDADLIDWKVIAVPLLDGEFVCTTKLDGFYAIKQDVDAMPAADVQEVEHGHWDEIREAYGKLEGWIHRECGRMSMGEDKYCPKCGARMEDNE